MEPRLKWSHKGPNGSAQYELKTEDETINFGVLFYTDKTWLFSCPVYGARWDMETADIWEAQTEAIIVLREHITELYNKMAQAMPYLDFNPDEYRATEPNGSNHHMIEWRGRTLYDGQFKLFNYKIKQGVVHLGNVVTHVGTMTELSVKKFIMASLLDSFPEARDTKIYSELEDCYARLLNTSNSGSLAQRIRERRANRVRSA